MFVAKGHHNKIQQKRWSKPQTFIFSQLQSLADVQDLCVSWFGFFQTSPWACTWLPSHYAFTWPFLCMHIPGVSVCPNFFIKDTRLDWGPPCMIPFNQLFKGLFFKYSHILKYFRLGLQHKMRGGGKLNSTLTWYLKYSYSQKQKVESWLLGARENGK